VNQPRRNGRGFVLSATYLAEEQPSAADYIVRPLVLEEETKVTFTYKAK